MHSNAINIVCGHLQTSKKLNEKCHSNIRHIKIISYLQFCSLVLFVLQSILLAFLLQFLASQCFIFSKFVFLMCFMYYNYTSTSILWLHMTFFQYG